MIYLDYNATTPCDPEVVAEMLPWFTEKFGNAGSRNHAAGWQADEAVKQARQQVASLIRAKSSEIIFTSGATESCNLAIRGVFEKYHKKGNHIITCQTEHHAVLDTCRNLEQKGAEVTYLPVDKHGQIRIEELEEAIQPETVLIAIMYANNETGVIQPIDKIGALARLHQVLFFCDATQALGKTPIDLSQQFIDLMAMSAHKMYGPKGVGALFARRRSPRVSLQPQVTGGGQENGIRSGTLNIPGIIGFGKACSLAQKKLPEEQEKLKEMQNRVEALFLKESQVAVNGHKAPRLNNVSNICIPGIRAALLSGGTEHKVAFSLGSACTSAQAGDSHVLKAMGLSELSLKGSFRLSYGRFTMAEELQTAARLILDAAKKLLLKEPA